MTTATPAATASVDYLLHLADNALVLGQRNAQWCGHGPVLEEVGRASCRERVWTVV